MQGLHHHHQNIRQLKVGGTQSSATYHIGDHCCHQGHGHVARPNLRHGLWLWYVKDFLEQKVNVGKAGHKEEQPNKTQVAQDLKVNTVCGSGVTDIGRVNKT